MGKGGGGVTQSTGTTYQTNVPEYAQPYVETMLGATQKQLFDMSGNEITGFKPYKPYSTSASDYIAPFSPMQEQAMRTATSPQAFGREVSGYMSPYMQNVVDVQKREALRAAGILGAKEQAQATGAGAFGGYREGIQRAENQRNLMTQMGDIQAMGSQKAFDQATQQARTAQGLQMQYGGVQQSLEQQKINQAIQDYANAQQYPLMQLGVMSNMLRGLPMQAATTNQYVAAPNPITQGIGVAGAGASIYNAMKTGAGAAGGLPSEFKYAKGGIAEVPRYDVGGEVESQLESMDTESLAKQAQESSSPTVRRMAQRILRERQMERSADQSVAPTGPMGIDYQAPQGMAGGGIIAFQQGKTVTDPERLAASAGTEAEIPGLVVRPRQTPAPVVVAPAQAAPAQPAPAQPAPAQAAPARTAPAAAPTRAAPAAVPEGIVAARMRQNTETGEMYDPGEGAPPPVEATRSLAAPAAAGITAAQPAAPAAAAMPTFTGPFADIERQAYLAQQRADRPESAFLEEVKAGTPENTAVAEYRKQVMAERANAKGEAERQRQMRMAEFFARWGSTPGPTLAAGLKALEKSIPDIIGDEKEQKKARRELDKVMYDIDNATRQEELGNKKEARALKEKAADRAMHLNQYLTQAKTSERTALIQQESSRYTADANVRAEQIRANSAAADRLARRESDADTKRFAQYQAATRQEEAALRAIQNEENGDQHKADVKTAGLRDEKGNIPAGMETRVQEAQERIRQRQAGWTARMENAKKDTELAYGRLNIRGGAEAAPSGRAAPAAAAPAATTVSRADIEATAKASGKTVAEVEAAAKAKGYTIK